MFGGWPPVLMRALYCFAVFVSDTQVVDAPVTNVVINGMRDGGSLQGFHSILGRFGSLARKQGV